MPAEELSDKPAEWLWDVPAPTFQLLPSDDEWDVPKLFPLLPDVPELFEWLLLNPLPVVSEVPPDCEPFTPALTPNTLTPAFPPTESELLSEWLWFPL